MEIASMLKNISRKIRFFNTAFLQLKYLVTTREFRIFQNERILYIFLLLVRIQIVI